ncbi:MAG: M24 family metallopeptidase, partial [Ferruginibacter sp.]
TVEELIELDKACTVTSRMHHAVMVGTKEGMYEYEAAAIAQKVMWDYHSQNAFLPIVTINGNVLHNHAHGNKLIAGKMLLFDSGTELPNGYCGDMTRTIPVGKTFSAKQRELYTIVHESYNKAVSLLQPGVLFMDVHIAACKVIANGLKQIGLMKGDVDEAVAAGAHAMFFQCGLGHMMGLDVHDMENLGEPYVGYTDELIKSKQFGLKSLRLGKAIQEGYVLTVEPGIYIIPELIDSWKAKGLHKEFINFDLLETYKNFGGIRVEDDYVITATGSRLLGEPLAINLQDVEDLRQ